MKKSNKDSLVEKFNLVHNNFYNYSKFEYINSRTKIRIICPKHGEFYQRIDAHKNGQGCKKCSVEKRILSKESLLIKMNEIHNNVYSYNLDNYKNSKSLISIFCNIHGEFKMTPNYHLSGYGCSLCNNKSTKYSTITREEIILKLNKIHNNRYEYPNLNIETNNSYITIKCPIHGEFDQIFKSHLNGHGCRKCYYERGDNVKLSDLNNIKETILESTKRTVTYKCEKHGILKSNTSNLVKNGCRKCKRERDNISKFRKKLYSKYGNRYTFDEDEFIDYKTPLKFYDNIRKLYFSQSPSYRLSDKVVNMNTDIFIFQSNKLHKERYNYDNTEYLNSKSKVIISCKEHGDFSQIPNNHLMGAGCPKCFKENPITEEEIYKFISSHYNNEIVRNDRSILNGKELDIYIPELKLGIEYNGLYWHSELYKEDNYHLNKTNLCESKGVQLIHIFEDEWLYKKDIVKSRLLNLLGKSNKIYARRCEVKEVGTKNKGEFLKENHTQGFVGSKVNLGLYYNDELVSLMTFGNLRKNLGNTPKEGSYELLRFCNVLNTTVVGGASKLFKHFIKNYKPEYILSYADRRWSNGGLYEKLGFEFIHNSPPNFHIISNKKRLNRFNFRKDVLVSEGYDANKTARQIMLDRGYYRIYDSGSKKYVFVNF